MYGKLMSLVKLQSDDTQRKTSKSLYIYTTYSMKIIKLDKGYFIHIHICVFKIM